MVMQRGSATRYRDSAAPLVSIGLTVAVLAIALYFMSEAFEERQSAAEAADLRAATLTLASANALIGTPLESSPVDLEASIAIIEGDHTVALHALTTAETQRAQFLLAALGTMSHSAAHSMDEHTELQELLRRAARESEADASEAEWRAAVAMALALLFVISTVLTLARARHRSDQATLVLEGEATSRHRLETMLNDLPDMLVVFDAAGTVTYRSASADRLLPADATIDDFVKRAPQPEQTALSAHLRTAPERSEIFEMRMCSGQGFFDIRVTDLADDEFVDGHLVTARDVTAELVLRSELEKQASLDVLTGLPNRRALDPVLDLARRRAGGAAVGLLLIDFDDFKDINDTLGHLVGDQLLREASARLLDVLRSSESLLRLGGDEFAVVLAPIGDERALESTADRVRAAMASAFKFAEATERVRTSIGAVLLESFVDADELLGKADIALYEAKRAGGDRLVVFKPAMEERAIADAAVARALRTVDMSSEFELHYQPIVDAGSGDVVSIEALLRWTSPTLGPVPPARFIPIAERLGLMPGIGDWVLDEVCRQVAQWESEGLADDVTVSFNVSAQQLAEPRFVTSVFDTADRWTIHPERLVAEVTESMVIDQQSAVIDRLGELRTGGIKIAIDDFGSGYSNLGQLLSVPLDTIKIDRELLLRLADMRDRAGGDPSDPCAIMQAIVTIASMLQAPVVCEGVETPAQRTSLRASGVTYLQGYLLGRPGPASEVVFPKAPQVRRRPTDERSPDTAALAS